MTTWLNTSFQIRFRVIDGLTVRFALGEDRREQALLLSPWPESLAQEFGDHPETAVIRMRSARAMAWEAFAGSAPDPGPRADAGPVLPVRPRLPAEQTSDSPGGGPYELTGQLPGLPHSPVAGSRLG